MSSTNLKTEKLPDIHDWNLEAGRSSQRKILLCDETLRDGLQAPSVDHPTFEEKRGILQLMEEVGIEGVNLGIPASSERVAADAVALNRAIAEDGLSITPRAAGRTVVSDMQAIADVVQKSGVPLKAMAFVGSSPLRLYAEDWSVEVVAQRVEEAITFAVSEGLDVGLVTEDTVRTSPEVVRMLYRIAVECGAKRAAICDTAGHATPAGVQRLVRFMREDVLVGSDDVLLEWHGHNDRGLAVANSLAAVEAGVDGVDATALGIGERAGNACMEQLIANLHLRGSYRADLSRIPEYASKVAGAFGIKVPIHQPIVGDNAFRTGSGVHASAILKSAEKSNRELMDAVYSSIPAAALGLSQEIEIGPNSGAANVVWWIQASGLPVDSERRKDAVDAVLAVAKNARRPLNDTELTTLVAPFAKLSIGDTIDLCEKELVND